MSALSVGTPPWFHLLAGEEPAVFLVPGSMLFDLDQETFEAAERGDLEALALLRGYAPARPAGPVTPQPMTALSLNVAQACNMACSYCYADEGRFGAAARLMDEKTAFAGIDALVAGADGRSVTLGFIGGEPFLNRSLVHASVAHARAAAARAGIAIGFAVTTNATLIQDCDIQLLRDNGFAVTVSIDGGPGQNRNRTLRGGRDSTSATLAGIAPLLADPGAARIAARCTLARDDLDVGGRIAWLAAQGFEDIGVAPVRTGPRKDLALRPEDWSELLAAMTRAAEQELARVLSGEPPRFSNLWVALRAVHKGRAGPLPCGSAASYLSLDANGQFYSCHRTVGTRDFLLGSLESGVDEAARRAFVEARHVDTQEPCRSCWARYLCGGGCHAEVAAIGRSGCDFIRGWLEFCLRAYRQVADRRPELLTRGET